MYSGCVTHPAIPVGFALWMDLKTVQEGPLGSFNGVFAKSC